MGTRPARVLVVDAESLSRWAVRESLTQAGFQVCESDGESLADCDQPIDVLVLDATLRRCGAMEILQRVRAHSPRCRVVLLTELDDISLARLGPPTPKWRALQKPFDVADLVSAVRSLAA
jgi:DNA-binding NtrC family response regulator